MEVLREFSFIGSDSTPGMFLEESQVIHMGVPPIRIEPLTSASGIRFEECYAERIIEDWDAAKVNILSLPKLKANK